MSAGAVRASHVGKVFAAGGAGVVAVEDASFTVGHQEFVSFVGPSGCGKSTILRMVGGLIPKTSGSLQVNGNEVDGPPDDVAISFQSPVLLPWKTVEKNVLLPVRLEGELNEEARRRARELLGIVGLQDFASRYPQQLSGGMQQRAALARLLMTGARILLLDEPFGALDEFTRERLNLELMRITREFEVTTVFVTHNIQEAVFLADRVVVMTPHPGTVAGVIDVQLPRPRDVSLLNAPEFNELALKVREILGMVVRTGSELEASGAR